MSSSAEELREQVRARYAESARAVAGEGDGCGSGGCCGDETEGEMFGWALYAAEQRGELPDAAVRASLGCGNPTAVADLHQGETVLDLGSGGGIDVILSAHSRRPSTRQASRPPASSRSRSSSRMRSPTACTARS